MFKSILAIFLTFFISTAFSQTADEVINNYITAVGGIDKINSIKTAKITGKFSAGSMDIGFVRLYKRPAQIKTEMSIQGMTMIQAYDGTTAWMLNPFQGSRDPEKMSAVDGKYLKISADFEGQFVNYAEKGNTVEFIEKDDFEGTDVYKLKLTDKDGDVNYYYFDTQSGLLLKQSTKRKIGEKEVKTDIIYGNYKSVEGFLYPFAVEVLAPDSPMGGSQKAIVETMELNVATEDSDYSMPQK